MISSKMMDCVQSGSLIRNMFEEGKRLEKIYGKDNVYDFSLGNPNVHPPKEVKNAILEILEQEDENLIHGYMKNVGYDDVRSCIACSLNKRFDTKFNEKNIVMTVGAAGGLNIIFKTLINPGDEIISFIPYFGEYNSYASNYGAEMVKISPNLKDFQPNLEEFSEKITKRTKIVIINSPNNPTGVVYSEESLKGISEILRAKELEFGTSIYLVSDEPYREIVYDGIEVPYITKYYHNTIIGYSYSKTLSVPGERIGYVVVPEEVDDFQQIIEALGVANRILGYVNAPSLFQRVVSRCIDAKVDIDFYDRNRQLLYQSLKDFGYNCVYPQGAFYLFVKSPIEDDEEFCRIAKEYNILIVPGSYFGCPGYLRISYCVGFETIEKSLPKFKELLQRTCKSKICNI